MKIQGYLPLAITGLILLAFYLIGITIPEETIRQLVQQAGPYGVVVYILLVLSTQVFAPLSGTPFILAGIYLYGSGGILYMYIAAAISVATNFFIAKRWGRSLVVKLIEKGSLEKVDSYIKSYGIISLVLARLLLNGFHDIVSYAFGLTTIKFKPYFLISIGAILPNGLLWYFIFTKVKNPLVYVGLNYLAVYLFLAIYLLIIAFRKRI